MNWFLNYSWREAKRKCVVSFDRSIDSNERNVKWCCCLRERRRKRNEVAIVQLNSTS